VLAADFAPNLGVETPFHARHSALRKTYEYRIFPRVAGFSETQPDLICPPTLAPYVWDCPWPIDLVLANRAAAAVLGEHDFASFAASDPDATQREGQPAPGTIRRIFASHWQRIPQAPGQPDLLIYRVTGTGFLHNMVRILVGTFVDIAAGRIAPDVIPDILAARRRSAAGPTAPARGLFLLHVEYPHATAAPQPAPAEAHA
jgi:tRNA pseudouridine38-40 synthase